MFHIREPTEMSEVPPMTEAETLAVMAALERRVAELTRENADLKRHNEQLRETVAALMRPNVSENFTKPVPDKGYFW
jgi:cell division protein FtsB